MSENAALQRVTEPDRERRPFGVVDIETRGLGGEFICGAWATEGEPEVVHYFDHLNDFLETVMRKKYRGYIWYAHNGGEYDYKYLIEPLREYVREGAIVRPLIQGERRVYGFDIKVGHKCYKLRDSFVLLPSSLAKISATFAPQYAKLDIGLKDGEIFDPSKVEHLLYLQNDVLGLLHSLLKFDSIVHDNFGVHLRSTLASTAEKAVRRCLPEGQIYWRPRKEVDDIAREAYYGGLVFLTDTDEHADMTGYDVNAMYATAMRGGVPVGCAFYTHTLYHPGFYRVTVKAPEAAPLYFVPYRDNKGLAWARGEFDTTVTSQEIIEGRRLGYEIEIKEGFAFDGISKIFDEFIDKCERLEVPNKGNPLGESVKLLRNCAYGKYGSRPWQPKYILSATEPEGYEPAMDVHSVKLKAIEHVWWKQESKLHAYNHPEWAAWITATARIMLVRLNESTGWSAVYGDTDSIVVPRDEYGLNKGLYYGQVKVDKEIESFRAYGPKNYRAVLKDGSVLQRAKGIPTRLLNDQAREKGAVQFDSMNSTLAVLTRGAPFVQVRTRSVSRIGNSSGWAVEDGLVRPRKIEKT